MTLFLQHLFDGIGAGAIYALLAFALVLVFRATGAVNFAQGEIALASTYIVWELTDRGFGVWLALAISLTVSFFAGVGLERALMRPLLGSHEFRLVIVTIGLMLAINQGVAWVWTAQIRTVPSLFPDGVAEVFGARISYHVLGTVVVLVAVLVAVAAFFRFTLLGLAMQAVATNRESSELVGVPSGRMLMLAWGLAAVFGGLAGVLTAPRIFLEPNMMLGVLVYALAGAVLGGFNSVLGATVGGMVVGVAEAIGSGYLGVVSSDLKVLIPLGIIVLTLRFRPHGLFGRPEVTRV